MPISLSSEILLVIRSLSTEEAFLLYLFLLDNLSTLAVLLETHMPIWVKPYIVGGKRKL